VAARGWDEELDLVVIGSGAAGLTAAATARGLETVVCEKTGFWGGTTAYSGGALWIPANPLQLADGEQDSIEDGLAYLDDVVGDEGPATSRERKLAFLNGGPELVRLLADNGFRWIRAHDYPDYYPDRPGGRIGRAVEGAIVDGRLLGAWLATLRRRGDVPPIASSTGDFAQLALALRTWQGLTRAAAVGGRTALWRASRRVPLSAGLSLAAQLMAIAQRNGATVWLRSPLQELVVEDGRVAGVVVVRDGEPRRIGARRGVLLAAGGFARDDAFRRSLQGVGDAWSSAARGDTGDAIRAGIAAGAATALMDEAWWGPAFVTPDGARIFSLWERSLPGAIIVDAAGSRFANESASYLDVGRAILERERREPPMPCWLVLDGRHRRRYPFGAVPPAYTPGGLVSSGFLVKARTLDKLAARTGIDPAGLAAAVERFNAFARTGLDADFGRGGNAYDRYYGDPRARPNPNLGVIAHPPFWAVRIRPGDLGTKGGLLTDADARVVREDGTPIEGLYAAGNTTASVMGRTYPGPGGTIAPAMVFAHRAVVHAQGRNTGSASNASTTSPRSSSRNARGSGDSG
jgi:3-oxosteroid 1-dehydrogenase